MKRFLKILFLCLAITVLSFNIRVYADDKEYNIENAEFNVYLDESGNAHVNEKWEINFTKGDFTRFYVSRLKDTNELEQYNSINFENFRINDVDCNKTADVDNRPEGTYSIVDNGDTLEYAWYFRANGTKMILENSYVLTNVVKCNENGYAFFCYRFIGKDFSKEIDNLKINIYSPKSCNIEVRNDSNMNYIINEDNVNLSSSNSSGLVKVNVAMNKGVFSPNIQTISQEILDKITEENEDGFWITLLIGVVGIIALLVVMLIKREKRLKLAKDEKYVYKIFNDLSADNITPFEFSRMCILPRIPINEFKLIFLDLLRRGIITIREKKIYISYEIKDSLKDYEISVMEAMNRYGEKEGYVSMDGLLTLLKDSRHLNIKNRNKEYKESCKKYKKEIKVIKTYFDLNGSRYTDSMEEVIRKYN